MLDAHVAVKPLISSTLSVVDEHAAPNEIEAKRLVP
jgi:hypothetical protein